MTLALALTGCGGDSSTSNFPAGNSGLSAPAPDGALPLPAVTGRVELGVAIADAQVSAYTLEGDLVARVNAGPTGHFFFSQTLPRHFRLVARFGTQTLSTEVRDYNGRGLYAPINVPTSLVSLAAGNDLQLATAEQQVRSILGIPVGTSLATGIEESRRAPFSHLRFLLDSAAAGGPLPLARQLLSQNQFHPFRLDASALQASSSSLPSELQAVVARLRERQNVRISVRGKSSAKAILVEGVGKDLGDLVWDGLTGNIRDTATNALWTWTAEQLGFHYGTGPELDEILNGLTSIKNELASLDTQITQAQFDSEFKAVNTTVNNLNLLIQDNTDAGQQLGWAPNGAGQSSLQGFRADSAPTDAIADFTNLVAGYTAAIDLAALQRYSLGLEGNSNLVTSSFPLWSQLYGFDRPGRFANFPVRSNALLQEALQTQSYLDGYQQLALNYLVENAHEGLGVASKIASTQLELQRAQSLQLQSRQQAPPLLVSDDILVDLENGLMWSLKAPGYDTYENALSEASVFNVTVNNATLVNWRLPTKNEYIALQQRGRFVLHSQWPATDGVTIDTPINSNSGEGDTGCSLRGLSALGFDGLNAKKTDSSDYIFDQKGSCWYNRYYTPDGVSSGPWQLEKYQEFHLNLANDNTNGEDSSKLRPYFLCRSLGKEPLLLPGDLGSTGRDYNLPVPPIPTDWTMDDLTDQEVASLGVPTALGNVTMVNSTLQVPVTLRVSLGGAFQYAGGNPLAGQTGSNKIDRTVPNAGSQLQVNFTSDNSRVTVRNTPGASNGQIQFQNHSPNSATVNATISVAHLGGIDLTSGFFPVRLVQNSLINSPSPVTPRALKSLLILPGNRQYTLPAQTRQSDLFQILGFYDDNSVADLSTSCNLTLSDVTNPQPLDASGAHFINANPYMQLNLDAAHLLNSNLQLTATYQGVTSTTLLNITLP